ncbi:MAG: hypothetical protein KF900_14460 [Bacteroidetes bacterium]|nr:hypothetical protein [Bacteroidota bacterium]
MFTFAKISAQEKLGMSNSNYMPSYGVFLNPSNSVDNWTYQQINFVGINAYFMNNIAYLPKFSVWNLAKTQDFGSVKPSNLKLKQFLFANAEALAPSYFISKGLLGGGLFVRGRTVANFTNLPYKLTNMMFSQDESAQTSGELNQKNLRFSNMSWIEAGLNFGGIIRRDRLTLMTLGGNLKYISGINIAYGYLQELRGFYTESTTDIQSLKGKVRYNQSALNSGKGVGLDVGFTYKKMLGVVKNYYTHSPKSNCKFVDYKYKFGISLRDAGFVRFNKNTNKFDVSGSRFFPFMPSGGYLDILENNFSTSTVTNAAIMASLPLSASAQFDYNFENNLFVNVTLVKNLVLNRMTGVQSANLICIAPRFEMKQIEVSLPLTLHRFLYPQLGFAFRYRSFVLGFDNVFPLVIKKNTYGANVYISIGATAFINRDCDRVANSVDNCPSWLKVFKPKQKRRKRK